MSAQYNSALSNKRVVKAFKTIILPEAICGSPKSII